MKTKTNAISPIAAALLALLGGVALAQRSGQDKYTLTVPDGLSFAEIKGYETWQDCRGQCNENPSQGDSRKSGND